ENDATEKSPEDSSLEDNGTADQQVNTGSRDVSTAVTSLALFLMTTPLSSFLFLYTHFIPIAL
ncbi:hypothetical protein Tco_0159537, partial [Tanacetum coccineum]